MESGLMGMNWSPGVYSLCSLSLCHQIEGNSLLLGTVESSLTEGVLSCFMREGCEEGELPSCLFFVLRTKDYTCSRA